MPDAPSRGRLVVKDIAVIRAVVRRIVVEVVAGVAGVAIVGKVAVVR
jgi:hypothetical protein